MAKPPPSNDRPNQGSTRNTGPKPASDQPDNRKPPRGNPHGNEKR